MDIRATIPSPARAIIPIPPASAGAASTIMSDTSLVIVPLLAVMPADPTIIPVTSPDELTIATDGLVLDHIKVGQTKLALYWSIHVASSCCVAPI